MGNHRLKIKKFLSTLSVTTPRGTSGPVPPPAEAFVETKCRMRAGFVAHTICFGGSTAEWVQRRRLRHPYGGIFGGMRASDLNLNSDLSST